MPCCKCNRTGSCKGCVCVKAGNPCTNCLPSKLNSCVNRPPDSSCPQPPSTVLTPIYQFNAPQTADLPVDDAPISSAHTNLPFHPHDPPTNADYDPNTTLPSPEPVSMQGFTWGNHSAADFTNILEATYSEVVHWRRNCCLERRLQLWKEGNLNDLVLEGIGQSKIGYQNTLTQNLQRMLPGPLPI